MSRRQARDARLLLLALLLSFLLEAERAGAWGPEALGSRDEPSLESLPRISPHHSFF